MFLKNCLVSLQDGKVSCGFRNYIKDALSCLVSRETGNEEVIYTQKIPWKNCAAKHATNVTKDAKIPYLTYQVKSGKIDKEITSNL